MVIKDGSEKYYHILLKSRLKIWFFSSLFGIVQLLCTNSKKYRVNSIAIINICSTLYHNILNYLTTELKASEKTYYY